MYKRPRAAAVLLCVIFGLIIALSVSAGSTNKAMSNVTTPVKAAPITVESMVLYEQDEPATPIHYIEEEPLYSLTQEEIDLIALVTMGEAEGETELGKRLVIDTILNRMDDEHFPDTVYDVIYQPNQFSVMWNGRIDRCYVMPEIVELVKEELIERTNYECVFFMAGGYSRYGEPMFQECCHYFSSYD